MSPLPKKAVSVWLWILCLAALAVGARNFEEGLSLDGPVYATIARNIAAGASWFRMSASIPDFVPFAEHPHLGFWLQAAILKVLPAEDWAVRLLGHVWFILFLATLYFYLRRKSSERVAVVSVTLLCTCHIFSNTFSTFYLDPGVLVLGTWSWIAFEKSVEEKRIWWGAAAGALFGLASLYKGLTVLGFLPAFAWIFLRDLKNSWRAAGLALLAVAGILALYFFAIRRSDCPEFLQVYWSRQVTARFLRKASLANVFRPEFWWQLLKYSNFLLVLTPLTLPWLKKRKALVLPWILMASFILQFAANGLTGGQYLIMILPWVTWLAVEVLVKYVPFFAKAAPEKWMRYSAGVALTLVVCLQYLPVRLHGRGPLPQWQELRRLSDRGLVTDLYLDVPGSPSTVDPFIRSSSWAWYSNVRVHYPEGVPQVGEKWAFYQFHNDEKQFNALLEKGWCVQFENEDGRLWIHCP